MLKIRLQRYGRTNDPSFRVVVLEGTRGPKAGSHVDQIGFYNAVTKQKSLDAERAKYWIAHGAQPTDRVYNMLVDAGVIEGKKRNVLPQKTPIVKEQPVEEVAAPEAAAEAQAEAPTEAVAEPVVASAETTPEEAPVETPAEAPAEEAPAEEAPVEAPTEAPEATEEPKTE